MEGSFKFELRRQIVHVLFGIVVIIAAVYDRSFAIWSLFVLLIVGLVVSLLNLWVPLCEIGIFRSIARFCERPEYKRRFLFKGAIFFFTGCLLVLKLFPVDTALAAIAILTFGDSVSHVFGLRGRMKSPFDGSKKVEGIVVGILAATVAASFFVSPLRAFFGAVVGMIAETLSFKLQEEEVDDNVVVPLVAGTVIYLLREIF